MGHRQLTQTHREIFSPAEGSERFHQNHSGDTRLCAFQHQQRNEAQWGNDQSNGLPQQFFPRSVDFSRLTNERIERAVALINHRPRKKFGYHSTVEFLQENRKRFVLQCI